MISLVTINFNNADVTIRLLRTLENQTDRHFDVLVVDNASEPSDRAQLGEYASTSPLRLDLLMSEENRGFSGGNNMAIRKALEQGTQWVVLINNDTTVPENFIETLRPQLERSAAVIGLPLQEDEKTAYAGIVRWLKSTLLHVYEPAIRDELMEQEYSLYAIGAGVAIHRNVFKKIGFLDERYFLYFEDADFSVRARKAGIPVRFVDAPVIRHAVSQSTSRLGAPLLLRYHARNALLFNKLHGPLWVRVLLPGAAFYGIFLQFLKILLMPSRRAAARAIRDGILDFYGKRYGKLSIQSQDNRY